jgi:hypothetical protein
MFNFLNSAVLIAAAAALIPLLIHLFSRRRVKVVSFSSLKYLKEMQKRQVRRIKIRQLLLLILRMLIILVAVLAFARPASKGGYIGSHAGVSSVILLDRSASMQRQVKDGRLFDLAKIKVGEILKNFGQSDELLLIPFDRQTYFPAGERFFSRDVTENILADLNAGYDRDNLEESFQKGVRLLREASNLNKELYLITDNQSNSLPEKQDSSLSGINTYLIDFPLETDGNCGVINVDLGGQLLEVGSDFAVRAEIENYDDRAKSQQLASLFIDGVRVMQTEFQIDAAGKQTVQFRSSVRAAGFHSGWVEIADDGFPPDNRYYFSFKIPEQFNILVISGDIGGELIRLALVPSEELARYWSVKVIESGQLSSIRLSDYDAVIISGVSSLGTVETSQLLRFVDGGGGLFYILGANMDTAYFNKNYGGRMDLTLLKPPPSEFSGAGYYSLERFDFNHPIFKAFAGLEKENTATLKFYALPEVKSGSGHRDLAFFSNGSPALMESGLGAGKIIIFSGDITPVYSDLASHSFFVPFIIRTVEYLAGDIGSYELKNHIGLNILRTLTEKETGFGTIQLITPDNRSFLISGTEQAGQSIYDCRPIDIPGLYQLKANNRTVDLFPANVVSLEGDLSIAGFDQIKKSLRLEKLTILPYNKPSERIITEARFGRELWQIFLWAAALLMAVEMIFSREKELAIEE